MKYVVSQDGLTYLSSDRNLMGTQEIWFLKSTVA